MKSFLLVLAGLLSGCAQRSPSYDPTLAARLQQPAYLEAATTAADAVRSDPSRIQVDDRQLLSPPYGLYTEVVPHLELAAKLAYTLAGSKYILTPLLPDKFRVSDGGDLNARLYVLDEKIGPQEMISRYYLEGDIRIPLAIGMAYDVPFRMDLTLLVTPEESRTRVVVDGKAVVDKWLARQVATLFPGVIAKKASIISDSVDKLVTRLFADPDECLGILAREQPDISAAQIRDWVARYRPAHP